MSSNLDDTKYFYLLFKQPNNMKQLQGLLPLVTLPITQQSVARFLQMKNCTIPTILNMHSLKKKQGYSNSDREVDNAFCLPMEQEESHSNSHAMTKNKKSGLLCGLWIFAPSRVRKVQSLPLATAAFSSPGDGQRMGLVMYWREDYSDDL